MTTAATFTLDPTQAIGQIAVALPGATAIFRRLKMDYCCGGQISLEAAADKKHLDLEPILQELAQLAERRHDDTALSITDVPALIDHILTRYHDVHRAQLPELILMARRVEAVHRDHPNAPVGLAQLLTEMEVDLLNHMQKEEQVLFPMLKAGGNAFVVHPIGMMRSEHIDHGATLERLAALTQEMTPPPGACTTWRALYAGLAQLADDLVNHIHLENNVLFPLFEPETQVGEEFRGGCQVTSNNPAKSCC
ncbi:iron-sulfur cluster repair protein YtfE [Parvibium lacunae]|uniref:Iron-sulfur cluster repair protein YtfE n=1 Tax=Parvibium lacunae TaxID=1888893 RepID=A0A368L6V3_9BURK|nr:iron-sulfur cluster repair protein YtfE [Parvibium lacunae]RCS59418.1 iron-sulfur cluster repair protein YtfE [Parvibium lacunae]